METRVSDVTTAALAPHERAGRGDELPDRPTVSVIICAYTEDRWLQLEKSVASLEAQTSPPIEIIVCCHELAVSRGELGW
jgi:cellulose synthase/poly-beta-1,6-N-acetylglucosamine synthase-like glycosyltransferase